MQANSTTPNSVPLSSAAREIVYVTHSQTIGTYLVDPASGSMTQAGTDITVQDVASPGAGALNVTASPDGRFLYVILFDANGNPSMGVSPPMRKAFLNCPLSRW